MVLKITKLLCSFVKHDLNNIYEKNLLFKAMLEIIQNFEDVGKLKPSVIS